MIATNKLKLVTAVLAAVGVLAGGSVGLVKADEPKPAAKAQIGPTLDDKQFLTRTCETLRGSAPTSAEMAYFLADQDAGKRKKVVTWLTEEPKADVVLFLNTAVTEELGVADGRRYLDTRFRAVPTTTTETTARLHLATKDDLEVVVLDEEPKANPPKPVGGEWVVESDTLFDLNVTSAATASDDTDEAFLNRAIESARGGKPTRIEKEYFLADKDAKKREKLLDQLLKDPAVAKKVGPDWKQIMLNPPQRYTFAVMLDRSGTPWADKLIDDLLGKKKSDEQILEALTLAATGRLPTDTEKKLAAAMVAKQKEKKAAWQEVAGTLAGTDEAKKHAERLKPNVNVLNVRTRLVGDEVRPTQTKPAQPKK